MTRVECPREQDVLDTLASRRWPDRAGQGLRAHVAACTVCADLLVVAGALIDGDEPLSVPRELPPAGVVWWRAQLRAREEATRAALRPIRAVQAAAAVCAGVLFLMFAANLLPSAGAAVHAVAGVVGQIAATIAMLDVHADAAASFASAALATRGVQLAAGAWLVLAPVAAYLAFARE
jgi:hypothetical protein